MLVDIGIFELKKSYLSLVQASVQLSQGSSSGKENNALEGILICHVDGIVYGGTNKFESKYLNWNRHLSLTQKMQKYQ